MAGFVQIIEITTSQVDEIRRLTEEYRAASAGQDGAVRSTIVQDRDRANVYINVVEFESYDAAMANSARPETGAFAEKLAKLCDGPPTFRNCDLVQVTER